MTNHPNRGPYTAELHGPHLPEAPRAIFRTILEGRQWAESFGTTADWCDIYDATGRLTGKHQRDPSGNGTGWYRAVI
jgi:hypothetical protein